MQHLRQKILAVLAAFFFSVSFSSSSAAFEMGPLSATIKAGKFGPWRVAYEFGAVVLDNESGEKLARTYSIPTNASNVGKRSFAVNTSLYSQDASAHAGLLYGYSSSTQPYFVFGVGSDGTPQVARFSNGAFSVVQTFEKTASETVNLRITEQGEETRFAVNGVDKAILRLETKSNGIGIVAIGRGRARFVGFEVSGIGTPKPQLIETISKPKEKPKPTAQSEFKSQNIMGQSGLPSGTFRVKSVQINDVWGIEKGTVKAASVLVPSGWTFKGEKVVWVTKGCLQRTIQSPFELTSPDGDVLISKAVTQQVLWTNQPGQNSACPKVRIDSADQMVTYLMGLTKFKNARLVEKVRLPDLVKAQKRYYRRDALGALFMDHMAFIVDYENNGRPFRAGMFFNSIHNQINMSDGWGSSFQSISATAEPQFMSAPREKFDRYMPVYQMVMNSYRFDPAWQTKVNRLFAKMRREDQKTFVAINKINQQSHKDIMAINQSIYDTKNASSDKQHQNFIEMIRDEQTVQTSTGPTVTPAGNVWETKNGELIVSSNPNFDPNEVGVTATKLNPVRR